MRELCAALCFYRSIKIQLYKFYNLNDLNKKLPMITIIARYCVVKVDYKMTLKVRPAKNQRLHVTDSFIQTIGINQIALRMLPKSENTRATRYVYNGEKIHQISSIPLKVQPRLSKSSMFDILGWTKNKTDFQST